MKKMREMRPSGVEWIGNIPQEWEINNAFQIFGQVKNKNIGLRETNLLSLSYGKIKRKSISTVGGLNIWCVSYHVSTIGSVNCVYSMIS